MINEEIVDMALDEFDECEQGIRFLTKMIRHTEDHDIRQALERALSKKKNKYKLIQALLCDEYEKLEIEIIKTHLHG